MRSLDGFVDAMVHLQARSPDHTKRAGKGQNRSPKWKWENSALEERTIL